MDAAVVQLVLFSTIAACVYMFHSLYRSVGQRRCSKLKAIVWYAGASLLPAVLFFLAFLLAVGLEEVTGAAWIGELLARSLVPVGIMAVGLALLANVAFVVAVAMMKLGSRP